MENPSFQPEIADLAPYSSWRFIGRMMRTVPSLRDHNVALLNSGLSSLNDGKFDRLLSQLFGLRGPPRCPRERRNGTQA